MSPTPFPLLLSLTPSHCFSPSLPLGESCQQLADGSLGDGDGGHAVDGLQVGQVSEEVEDVTGVHARVHYGWPADVQEIHYGRGRRVNLHNIDSHIQHKGGMHYTTHVQYIHHCMHRVHELVYNYNSSLELGHDGEATELQEVGGATAPGRPPGLPQSEYVPILKLCNKMAEATRWRRQQDGGGIIRDEVRDSMQ